jgi:ParB family chromosome partitioning protein
MAKRDRLGKGLGALLGEHLRDDSKSGGVDVRTLPVDSIEPNPFQPRREFEEQELADLAASIGENGLLQPVVVRPAGSGKPRRWELVAGERRWRAVQRLGWAEIPALVRPLDDRAMLVVALVENLQRAELSPLEEATGYQRLIDEFQLSQQQVAEMVGRDRSTVANALRLLQLPASVRRLLEEGKLTAGHARALLGAGDERVVAELAQRVVREGWNVRQVEAEAQRLRPVRESKPRAPQPREAAERRLEEELQRALGTAVKIHRNRGMKGRIEIPFYGAEDFERIYEILVGAPASDAVS